MVGFDKSSYHTNVAVDGVWSSGKALLHTLFHILGRYHEHERTDRVKYIKVIEKNILEGLYMYIHYYVHLQSSKNYRRRKSYILAFLNNMMYKNAIKLLRIAK